MKIEENEIMSLMVNFTIEELKEKGKNETDFEWNFNLKNTNLIPILELYDKNKIIETIEATEFSEDLQDILKEIHNIYNWINQKYGYKAGKEFTSKLKLKVNECLECEARELCNLIRFKNKLF